MRDYLTIPVLVCLVAATAALAHQGVRNPVVKARMDAMVAIGENTKVIGDMVKGERPFDAAAARAAAAAIARHSERTPDLFEAREQDPVSEARDSIWENFEDFTAKSDALRVAAERAALTIEAPEDLGPALAGLGQACKACHGDYRE